MKKSQIIKNIISYENKRGVTTDDITFGDIFIEIVMLYPEAVLDPTVLMGWIHSCYHEEVMKLFENEFTAYLKNKTFAKKYIQKDILYENCKEVLDLHPEFLSTQWFAKIAINNFFPDDFIKIHCDKWLKNKSFLEKNKFNFTRRMNLFSEILTEDNYLDIINYNYFVATDVPKKYITKDFLNKVMRLPKAEEVIKSIYWSLPYELQSDKEILRFAVTFQDGRFLTYIDTEKIDKATYLSILENLKGSDTLFHFGEMLLKIYDKPWFDESVVYKTLSEFFNIYKNHGKLMGDGMGGAIYTTHPIKDALLKLKDKSPSLNFLFYSDARDKYFADIKSEKEIERFEKNISSIMQDYEPCYRKTILNTVLPTKPDKYKSLKI